MISTRKQSKRCLRPVHMTGVMAGPGSSGRPPIQRGSQNHRRQRRPSCNDSVCPLDHAANRNWQLKRYIRIIIRQTEIKRLLVVIKAQRDPSSIDHDDRLNTQSWLSSHFPVATCILQAVCLYPPLSISISNVQSSSSSALLQKP
jgi:hypothetical protein